MHEDICIETSENELSFVSNNRQIWNMGIANIADTRISVEDKHLSEWIIHLLQKKWAYTALLYNFAKEIQKLHPDNKIDWYETFMIVERKDYLEKAFRLKQKATKTDDKKSIFGTLVERIEFGQASYNDEETNAIEAILINHLKENELTYKL